MILTTTDVAKLVLKYFTKEQAPTMVAIAIAESSLNSDREGDSPSSLRNAGYNDSANIAKYWNCPSQGRTTDDTAGASIGLFQVFLGANHDLVMRLSGINFPLVDAGLSYPIPANEYAVCQLISWLKIPENNVKAAKAIFDSQGYGAWSVYKYPSGNPVYKQYLSQAKTAVESLVGSPEEQQPIYSFISQPVSIIAILGIGLTAALMTIFLTNKPKP